MVEQAFLPVPGRQECLPYRFFLFTDKLLNNFNNWKFGGIQRDLSSRFSAKPRGVIFP